ncbi:MAG: ABC transporter substrate-binding protein [Thermomicrobiales bacterium]|nr:ABC transporter substrate-binding protein [Thermomicrobiales bacterium]
MFNRVLTRRGFMQAGTGAALLLTLPERSVGAAQGTPVAAGAQGVQPDGTWMFTDDRGLTVTLPTLPTRIISSIEAGSALKDYGIDVLGVVSTIVDGAGNRLPEAGDLDETTLAYLGEWDSFDLEAALALDAELYVDVTFYPEDLTMLYNVSDDAVPLLEAAVGTIAIATGGGVSVEHPLARFRELAAALGADVNAAEITADVAAFEAAKETARTTFAEKSDVSAAFIYASPDEFTFYDPDKFADTIFYQELGLNALPITATDGYTEPLSLEQLQKHSFDAFFQLLPNGEPPGFGLDAIPTIDALPSVPAGQVYRWQRNYAPSYRQFLPIFEAFVADMASAEKVT